MESAMRPDRSLRRARLSFVLLALGVIAWLALAVTVGAQTNTPDAAAAKPAPVTTPAKAAPAPKSAKAAKKPSPSDFKLVLEPRAMDLLKAVSDKLAAAKTMSFTAV